MKLKPWLYPMSAFLRREAMRSRDLCGAEQTTRSGGRPARKGGEDTLELLQVLQAQGRVGAEVSRLRKRPPQILHAAARRLVRRRDCKRMRDPTHKFDLLDRLRRFPVAQLKQPRVLAFLSCSEPIEIEDRGPHLHNNKLATERGVPKHPKQRPPEEEHAPRASQSWESRDARAP